MIGGHFLLVMPLSKRSDGAVWQAMDTNTGHQVALNLLGSAKSQEQIDRFLDTARLVQAVEHRNVVRVLEWGYFEDGQVFSTTELLDGLTLADRLAEEPPLTLAELVHVGAQALEGVAALHAAGAVHGHIEPDSIFIEAVLGRLPVKLIGIGRARSGDPNVAGGDLQNFRSIVYAAPEQVAGHVSVTGKADLYSLGVVLFEAVAGKLPLHGRTPDDLMSAILATIKPSLRSVRPDVPAALSDAIAHALATDAGDRPADAMEMRKEIVSSMLEATDEVKKLLLPVVTKNAQLATRVVEWDYSELAQDVDPDALDKNLVIQVQSKRVRARPSQPSPGRVLITPAPSEAPSWSPRQAPAPTPVPAPRAPTPLPAAPAHRPAVPVEAAPSAAMGDLTHDRAPSPPVSPRRAPPREEVRREAPSPPARFEEREPDTDEFATPIPGSPTPSPPPPAPPAPPEPVAEEPMSAGFMAPRQGAQVDSADSALKELLGPPGAAPAPTAPRAYPSTPNVPPPPAYPPLQPAAVAPPSWPDFGAPTAPAPQAQPYGGYEAAAQGGGQAPLYPVFSGSEPISPVAPLARVAPAGGRKGLMIALVVILVLFLVVAALILVLAMMSGCSAAGAGAGVSASLGSRAVALISAVATAPLSTPFIA
jgi:serine/threonine protein kinase